VVGAEHRGDGNDDLLAAAADQHDRPARPLVLGDQPPGLGVHQRRDEGGEGLVHDRAHPARRPTAGQLREVVAHPLHPRRVGACGLDDQLRVSTAQYGAAADQAGAIERPAERERASAGDDRSVEVEERRSADRH